MPKYSQHPILKYPQSSFLPKCERPKFHSHTKQQAKLYEGWNFNRGNYLFTTDTK